MAAVNESRWESAETGPSFHARPQSAGYALANEPQRGPERKSDLFFSIRTHNSTWLHELMHESSDPLPASKMNLTPLMVAAKVGDYSSATDLLRDQRASDEVNRVDGHGWTALHHAASHGFDRLVTLFLAHHANASACSRSPTHTHTHGHDEELLTIAAVAGCAAIGVERRHCIWRASMAMCAA
jgi:ankyrin repeat protein